MSLTDIANLALGLIGQRTIESIDDTTDELVQTMKRYMEPCIKEVQSMVNWDELVTGPYSPSFLTDEYAGEFGVYQYIMPANFLHVITTTSDRYNGIIYTGSSYSWELQNGFLIVPIEDLELFYQRLDLSPAKWSTQLTELTYTYLASKVCLTVSNDRGLSNDMKVEWKLVKSDVCATRQNRARSGRQRPSNFSQSRTRGSSSPGYYRYY